MRDRPAISKVRHGSSAPKAAGRASVYARSGRQTGPGRWARRGGCRTRPGRSARESEKAAFVAEVEKAAPQGVAQPRATRAKSLRHRPAHRLQHPPKMKSSSGIFPDTKSSRAEFTCGETSNQESYMDLPI